MTEHRTEHPSDRTGDAPGGEGDDHALTGAGGGTARDRYDHEGGTRDSAVPSDAGATDAAARELDAENESEPTRSE
ncbi:hypothetical protein [Pseudonocardia sp. WMMC193]|uniref:hypothetical protein n=1 Tax=Pseudonocardia sp. WMMC193 TaxID=2911965 RepID=UPI001F3A0A8E|nr:hypothetical protein [Pseudonocardia sp. WMMC193]MCF7553523.1 hypothetical protein [Pseudonocardia sp. WMMC193]